MLRTLGVLVVAGAIMAGCVSLEPVTAPTASATIAPGAPAARPTTSSVPTSPSTTAPIITTAPTPSAVVQATDKSLPSPAPSVVDTTQPSLEASPAPTPTSTAESNLSPVENYGANDPIFSDTFDDPSSGWGVGTNEDGSIAYIDSALQIDTVAPQAWELSARQTGTTSNVLNIEALLTPSASGYQGLFCANTADEQWGAVSTAEGKYAFIQRTGSGPTILANGQDNTLKMAPAQITRLALDCAGTATGTFRLQLTSPGTNLAASYQGDPGQGPESFDRVAVYGEAIDNPYSLRVDDLLVFGGTGDTSMSPAAADLLTHVPAAWHDICFESPSSFFDLGAEATITCQLDGGKSDFAEYTKFDTLESMQAAYRTRVDKWVAEQNTGSCDTGPGEGTWSIGGQSQGRILCAPQTTGTRLDWTLDSLLILSTLTDFEGSYTNMYADWLIAGPN